MFSFHTRRRMPAQMPSVTKSAQSGTKRGGDHREPVEQDIPAPPGDAARKKQNSDHAQHEQQRWSRAPGVAADRARRRDRQPTAPQRLTIGIGDQPGVIGAPRAAAAGSEKRGCRPSSE